MTTFRLLLPVVCAGLLIPSTHAAAQTLADCRAIEDRLARFDCYESLESDAAGPAEASERAQESPDRDAGAEERTASRPSDGVDSDASESPSVSDDGTAPRARTGTSDFGRRPDAAASRVVEEDGRTELHGTVADLVERMPNTWLITLEGGEQWLQMTSRPYRLRVGEPVRIYATRWGSAHRLTSERLSGYIQVERVD